MKLGYVLLDGCGDRPNPSLNYCTPLEAAVTPNLDKLAYNSRLGSVTTVGRGIAPESDIAVFNMLGYPFDKGYPGRGVVEAVGASVRFRDGDLALRANFATARRGRIVDRRAGRDLSQEEAQGLEREINSIRLNGAEVRFRSTVSYRGVLVVRDRRPLSSAVSNTDPAYSRVGGFGAARRTSVHEEILPARPEIGDPAAKRAAELVNEFSARAAKVLGASPVNRQRERSGKKPANCVLLRDAGSRLPKVASFKKRFGLDAVALVEMPAEVGIAKILGMDMVRIRDRSDMVAKAKAFVGSLREGRMVYAHIKGPDEFGHDGDAEGKKRCLESIDRDFFGRIGLESRSFSMAVSCDHATPCTLRMHSSDPVPLLLEDGGARDGMRFTERNARKGSMGHLRGADVLPTALGLLDDRR